MVKGVPAQAHVFEKPRDGFWQPSKLDAIGHFAPTPPDYTLYLQTGSTNAYLLMIITQNRTNTSLDVVSDKLWSSAEHT